MHGYKKGSQGEPKTTYKAFAKEKKMQPPQKAGPQEPKTRLKTPAKIQKKIRRGLWAMHVRNAVGWWVIAGLCRAII
jgi:hypothetical protein